MVSARGNSFQDTLSAVTRGERATGRITSFDATGFPSSMGAEVTGFDPRPHFRIPKALKLTDRTTQFAVAAASMALRQASWPTDDEFAERLGVLIGVSSSDLQVQDLAGALRSDGAPASVAHIPEFAERILSRLHPLWLLVNLPNMASAHVAIQLNARGPNSTVMTDWVAGSQAIGEAADWIRCGDADAVLAGGADTLIQPIALAGYDQAGLLTNAPDGPPWFVPGEGAAVLLLEERSHALSRGATVLAEISGYASGSAPVAGSRHALADTMDRARREAGWTAADISSIVMASHARSPLRAEEAAAIREVLGGDGAGVARADFQLALGNAGAALGPLSLCLMLGTAPDSPARNDERGLLCNAAGFSGQAVTLAVRPHASSEAAA